MRKNVLLIMAAFGGSLFCANNANAQESVVVEEQTVTVSEVQCKNHYYSNWRDNWFIELGAGMNVPFMESKLPDGSEKYHITAAYNLGFGKWMTPYLGWRVSLYGSTIHWDEQVMSSAKYANANFDLMWNMTNSLCGVNPKRVFSAIPYVGLGGTYTWDFKNAPGRDVYCGDKVKSDTWTLPVSAGIQFRFRLCDYVDFFVEGRAWFYADNFNNTAYCNPIDINVAALGGFNINIGGSNFKSYNPCNDLAYIGSLNNQINQLRGDLAVAAAALAVAESQLPCPEVVVPDCPEVQAAPMLTTVRFTINSSKITNTEMVNVFNVAEYMKANPQFNVVIRGYADKDTGTASYNKGLSQRRAQAVYDALTKKYGIDASRLTIEAEGSETQPYTTNNWNRIVIFVPAE